MRKPWLDPIAVPLDEAWTLETYKSDPQSKTRKYGALGFRSVTVLGDAEGTNRKLSVRVNLVSLDRNRRGGEVLRFLEDLPGLGRPADLRGARIDVDLVVPRELIGYPNDNGAQVILETETPDGIRARRYGTWTAIVDRNCCRPLEPDLPWVAVRASLVADAAITPEYSYTEPGFNPVRSLRIGVKVALSDSDMASPFSGRIFIKKVSIRRPGVSDEQILATLPPLPAPAPSTTVVPVAAKLKPGSPSAVSVDPALEPLAAKGAAASVGIAFDAYQAEASRRSARVRLDLDAPVDLTSKRVTAFAAVGPSLRGVMMRPNQVQLELYDDGGHVLRGPAAGVSNSVLFRSDGVPRATKWVPISAAVPHDIPLAMGFQDPLFQPNRVKSIGVRFEIGKNSHEILPTGFPVTGRLLLSDLRIDDAPFASPRTSGPASVAPFPTRPKSEPDEFIVGVNYPFIDYGWDVGQCPYGGREQGGFSSQATKIDRDFALFRQKGVDVVRVFLLDDLRTGVVFDDATGDVVGLDGYALSDIDAIVSAAVRNQLRLIPVLVDFLVADGSSSQDLGHERWQWREGEHVDAITVPSKRQLLLEHAIQPVLARLRTATSSRPETLYAIEIMNEPENAVAAVTAERFPELVDFVRETQRLIRKELPNVRITLGSRDRDDMVAFWKSLQFDLWQFHYYDKAGEEENHSLDAAASGLGVDGPIIVGELEPTNLSAKLDLLYQRGYGGALVWSYRGLDGFRVDLDALEAWKRIPRSRAKPAAISNGPISP